MSDTVAVQGLSKQRRFVGVHEHSSEGVLNTHEHICLQTLWQFTVQLMNSYALRCHSNCARRLPKCGSVDFFVAKTCKSVLKTMRLAVMCSTRMSYPELVVDCELSNASGRQDDGAGALPHQ